MNGVLLVNKPENITSHDAVVRIRKLFCTKKVGHAGTLDPFATGLLILCLGKATKIVQYISDRDKEYQAVMKLGETTDTQDYTGNILKKRDIVISEKDIWTTWVNFVGEISQVPPMFSARRVQGKRLYEIARTGKSAERTARNVTIYKLDILDITLPYIQFLVVCSKGTYIRTLAHDIGEVLGCGAHLTALQRTRIGPFVINDAFSFKQLMQMSEQIDKQKCLIPLDKALSFLPAVEISESASAQLAHGTPISLENREIGDMEQSDLQDQIIRVYSFSGEFIALARSTVIGCNSETLWQFEPIKVFV